MKKFILIVGAAALTFGAPALAKPGNGHGEGNPHAVMAHGNAHVWMTNGHGDRAMAYGYAHGRRTHGGYRATRNHGRLYAFGERGGCPPGLARKDNGCMPPGQARKLYNIGQRYNRNFGTFWSYGQIPTDLRSRYSFDQSDRYYYSTGYLYQVNPRTMLVQRVVSLLLN